MSRVFLVKRGVCMCLIVWKEYEENRRVFERC